MSHTTKQSLLQPSLGIGSEKDSLLKPWQYITTVKLLLPSDTLNVCLINLGMFCISQLPLINTNENSSSESSHNLSPFNRQCIPSKLAPTIPLQSNPFVVSHTILLYSSIVSWRNSRKQIGYLTDQFSQITWLGCWMVALQR